MYPTKAVIVLKRDTGIRDKINSPNYLNYIMLGSVKLIEKIFLKLKWDIVH